MYFNAMQREELKQAGWYEKADGSWEIDVDGYVYYLYREDDGLYVIVTDTEQFDASYDLNEMLTDFWS